MIVMNSRIVLKGFFFSIELCSAGQQYDRTSETCQNCPKDFYTNKTISQYCIKCPTGYITYGEGSDTCIPLSAPGIGTVTLRNVCELDIDMYNIYLLHVFSCAEQIWIFLSYSLYYISCKGEQNLFFSLNHYFRFLSFINGITQIVSKLLWNERHSNR